MTESKPSINNSIKGTFTVLNERGLHTRPSTELVKCASKFKCNLTLHTPDGMANAKSLLGILMLAATEGTEIRIEAEGEDATEAISSILNLANQKFSIDY